MINFFSLIRLHALNNNLFDISWLRLFIYTVMGVLAIHENPLGMADASDRAFQRAHNAFTAPYYNTVAQNDSLVVLLNDPSMKYLFNNGITEANGWPLLYSDHVLILEKILEFQPRAIFVDIYFKDKRSTDASFDEFEYLLDDAKEQGIPLLFAKGYADEVLSEAQISLNKYGGLVVNGWSNYREQYSLKPGGENSVALELYNIACKTAGKGYPSCSKKPLSSESIAVDDAIAVDWSSKASRNLFPDRIQMECEEPIPSLSSIPDGSTLERIRGAIRITLLSAKNALFGGEEAPCIYSNTLPAETLVSVVKRGSLDDVEALKEEIEDKIIFYAVDIGAMTDEFDSPVHGLLPGVYRHSMALDNLIAYGDKVKFKKDYLLDVGDSVTWFLMCWIVLYRKQNKTPEESLFGRFHIATFGVIPLVIWALASDLILGRNYESVNLLGYLTLMLMLVELVKNEFAAWVLELPGKIWSHLQKYWKWSFILLLLLLGGVWALSAPLSKEVSQFHNKSSQVSVKVKNQNKEMEQK
ncbi:CHASE2 domain protein [Marinobacterium sp. xm-d-579]|nr:CHASE2 domain protein [Marinobacterium sp. xm-d-579]